MFKIPKERLKEINFGTYYFVKYAHKFDNEYNENRRHSVNFDPIKIYGTIEFRIMEGTLDYKKISDWTNLHITILEWIKRNDSIIAMDKINHRVFIKQVLGETLYHDLRTRQLKYKKDHIKKIVKKKIDGGQNV
jgi:hypothetical protein